MLPTHEGLSLLDAAKAAGIPFNRQVEPQDEFITLDGLRFHYLDWGNDDKPTVLFLHGRGQQAHSWDFIALALCGAYHVLALDGRGHGDSDWPPDGDYSIEADQRDLNALLDTLGVGPVVLVGHSRGGRDAFVFASSCPEKVMALAIVDVGPESSGEGLGRIRRFRALPDEAESYDDFVRMVHDYTGRPVEQIRGSLKWNVHQLPSGKWTWKYDRVIRDPNHRSTNWPVERMWECLARVQCPTLLVKGERSDVLPMETAERMLQVIPHSTFAIVPGAGHLVAGDNPIGLLRVLRPFVESSLSKHIPLSGV